MIYLAGANSISIDVMIVDDSGLAVTGLVAATFPTLTYSVAGANADVAFPSLSDLAAITTAYASGGVKERGNGVYRLDLPSGCTAAGGVTTIRGEASGKHVICERLHVVAYNPQDAAALGLSRLDAATSSRMATYNQPTGFLAATFPTGTVANTTNITAGTITTTTNLTNAPTAGDLTATMKTSVTTAATAATPTAAAVTAGVTVTTNNGKTAYAITQAFPANFSSLSISAGGKINEVVLVDTLTTYTGNTPQSGDAFTLIGTAGAGLTALGDTRIAHLNADVSSRMATYTQPTGFLATVFAGTVGTSTYAGADTSGTTTLLGRVTGAVALASQIPANFTTACFVSAGVFSVGALANAPGGGGGGGDPMTNASTGYTSGEIGYEIHQTYQRLGAVSVTMVSPVQPVTGTLVFYSGSAYTLPDRAVVIAISPAVHDLTGVVSVQLRWGGVTLTSTSISNVGVTGQSVTFEADATVTTAWNIFNGEYTVWAIPTDASERRLDIVGSVNVRRPTPAVLS